VPYTLTWLLLVGLEEGEALHPEEVVLLGVTPKQTLRL